MLNKTLKINIPSSLLTALNESEEELKNEIKLSMAIKFYQKKKLTIGKAAQLAGLSRYEFEKILSVKKIPISNLSFKDVKKDIKKLEKLLK